MWLITYQQWPGKHNIIANKVIEKNPAEWLKDQLINSPTFETVLISSKAISVRQYDELKKLLG